MVAEEVDRFQPDVVISANTPLEAQAILWKSCRRRRIRHIYWVQDLLGIAIRKILKEKLSLPGDLIGRYYERLEQSLLKQSDNLILICEDFVPIISAWGVPSEKLHVIENWAPLEQANLPGQDALPAKDNPWSREQQIHDKFCVLYTGTMGMKHNPKLLLGLALHYEKDERFRVVVVAEGVAAAWLSKEMQQRDLKNLIVYPLQTDNLPYVLATADVLAALLETSASLYSVPSKVLTYLSAAKPLLLAVPAQNLASRIVLDHHAGLVVPPTDGEAFIQVVAALYPDDSLRAEMGRNARAYAESHFDIETITSRFERILQRN